METSDQVFDPASIPESRMHEGKKVLIACPWYRDVACRTAFSIFALLDRSKTAIALNWGDAFVAHARNKLTDNFLKTNLEWMLMVDSDMILPFGNAKLYNAFTGFNLPDKYAGMHTIDRLLSHGKTVVGGLYYGRWPGGKPVLSAGSESKTEEDFARQGPHDLIKPTRWVGTGACMFHRTVFLDIERNYPYLARNSSGVNGQWFSSSEHDITKAVSETMTVLDEPTDPEEKINKVRELLKRGQEKSRRFSGLSTGEDVILNHRAAQSGHQPYCDYGLVLGHSGEYVYGPKRV